MSDTIRILLADDHPVVRDGLVAILGTQPDFVVVGEAVKSFSNRILVSVFIKILCKIKTFWLEWSIIVSFLDHLNELWLEHFVGKNFFCVIL